MKSSMCLPAPFSPPLVSHQDCFIGQSAGCLGSLRAGCGWDWRRGAVFGEHLAQGGLVSLHVSVVGAILSEKASRERMHGGMVEQSGPSGD